MFCVISEAINSGIIDCWDGERSLEELLVASTLRPEEGGASSNCWLMWGCWNG